MDISFVFEKDTISIGEQTLFSKLEVGDMFRFGQPAMFHKKCSENSYLISGLNDAERPTDPNTPVYPAYGVRSETDWKKVRPDEIVLTQCGRFVFMQDEGEEARFIVIENNKIMRQFLMDPYEICMVYPPGSGHLKISGTSEHVKRALKMAKPFTP